MTPNEETGRRFCMLSEFMFGKPVFESYKSLCAKIGDETISYQEFDFWFHRFSQGKLDLSYDRSLDPKPKELSDMPVDVIENILDHLDVLERLPIRNVSRDLRDLIDKRITDVKQVNFTIAHDSFFVTVDNIHTNYKESEESKTTQYQYNNYNSFLRTLQKQYRKTIEGPDAMKNALKHLAYYLKNPKLKLKSLSIGVAEEAQEYGDWDNITQCYNRLESLLLSLEHQISTESFVYSHVCENTFLVVLLSLKPGVLEVIRGEAYWVRYEDYDIIDEIVGTEQWKQAKRFISWGTMPAIVDGIAHFEEFSMDWNETEPENVVRLKQLLSKSKTFKKGGLSIFNRLAFAHEDAIDRIVEALGPRIFRYPENPLKWSYPIPDANEFLDFISDRPFGFFIERTT